MGSHRAGKRTGSRQPRAHARPATGGRARSAALALGVFTVAAGVGTTLVANGGGQGAADSVAADVPDATLPSLGVNAAGGATPLVTPTPSATPTALPSATPTTSATVSATPSQRPTADRAERGATRSATSAAPSPARSTASAGSGGSTASGSGGSGGSGGSTGSGTGGGGSSSGTPADGAEAQVLALVNKERAAAGCGPVASDPQLTRAADDYSDVMAASGVMSHTGPDGSTMTSRVEAAGYAWSTLGENIARGQGDAEAVMDAWMNSPGHRANILNCSFTELGVGVHMGDGGPWWTQNFGAPR
ncbi:CAP domain-containing protein [Streptomyces sp. C10-9-1]|uniref:CAP domain-containing protein n=1 Tax=Streptomyces sp. C10-9-1 TaxID=1859285 RepID=UPI002111D85E|nr:CAP domain-containing protein [Streptomyces sp. C10-9-1]MCQ6551796.1 CAP domain-containing protein [Streptomyces sp. C10-9-1]